MLKPPPGSTIQDVNEPSAFYIQATAPSSRPRHSLKHGDTFCVCDAHGDIGVSPGSADGVYDNDTRFLSRLELLIDGQPPLHLGSSVRDDNVVLTVDLANADRYVDGHNVLQRDTVHVVRDVYLWEGMAHQRVRVTNYGSTAADLTVDLAFASDFADLFEARGAVRKKRGSLGAADVIEDQVTSTYVGLDGQRRQARLGFDPAPTRLTASSASYDMRLDAGGSQQFTLSLGCRGEALPRGVDFERGLAAATARQRRLVDRATTVETSNNLFNEMVRRSVVDLYMLTSDTPQGLFPYAGIPWFSTTFGRDALLTALQMLWFDPEVARGVLRRLAHYQAADVDPASDAEPGRILHEMRHGEMAALREVPFGLYYGASDATPLFVVLAGRYLARTGDVDTIRELWPNVERAVAWMVDYGDKDGDGFLEYRRETDEGLQNQCWKDSFDSIFHADGRIPHGPIATAEIQGYAYEAYGMAASCAERLGLDAKAAEMRQRASSLQLRFEEAFWCEDVQTYAIALDGDKRPCRVRTSNAGQVLWSGIANAERARIVSDAMVSPAFFSGWGIRTVAEGEARYNPMSYHDGSIWPHDNSLIVEGMARYGHARHVETVFSGLFDAATHMDLVRLPELFCGFARRAGAGPTLYPVACAPHAWAAASPLSMLQACLGLRFDPEGRSIRFVRPRLPAWLDAISLGNLSLGAAAVDITLTRAGAGVALSVDRTVGTLSVILEA